MLRKITLSHVARGMIAYDKDGTRIGTVKAFRLGVGTIVTDETDMVTMAHAVSECLNGRDDLTPLMYARLYDQGFICIDCGDDNMIIVFPNQIEDMIGDMIYLNIELDELLKI